ncbi:hypothetical protein J5N97_009667 [Dioscorea zingiberensis]|uniref:Uncharacterized protein n=1 Tax=Dioscorea zingiberensis TaxID=325984 RepID=A0A9D5CYR1_9LILI|nr:hypothetical protein J5N97_009667 [Dioscorea zingiberensis]
MAKKQSFADALQALFSVENPFRRKPHSNPPMPPALWPQLQPAEVGLGLGQEAILPDDDRKRKKEKEPDLRVSLKRKKKLERGDDVWLRRARVREGGSGRGMRSRSMKGGSLEGEGEVVEEKNGDGGKVVTIGEKRKALDLVNEIVVLKEEKEEEKEFDDE